MDLGCIDMGCLEKERSPKESTATSACKLGKSKAKDLMRSSSNALNKLTSQISKPPRRKTSPLNWFPRKKVEPYLKRKIKMLQEVDGMHLTLDETLEDSNPHYSKVLREKIAIREAAEKAMEARKAAMVEASWCRILRAARIESKEAEEQLSKAEISAAEALEAARAVGVIMNDIPDSAQNHYKIEEVISGKGGSTTHTVSATFETAFAVDKQVAAAVKAAFVKLANCHSSNKDEFKELLRKISENPDMDDYLSEITSECDSEAGSDMEAGSCEDSSKKQKKRPESRKFNTANIIDMMLGRLQCLKEDELASLATIVATSGLNAALAETENSKQCRLSTDIQKTENPCPKVLRRTSSVYGRIARNSKGGADAEIPSLDQFLVKRLTRLEREVLEAKKARKNEAGDSSSRSDGKLKDDGTMIPDLGSVLEKHSSELEKEIEEASVNSRSSEIDCKKSQRGRGKQDAVDLPSLDKYLVKRLTRLEMEVQEAKNRNRLEPTEKTTADLADSKENMDLNKEVLLLEDQNRKRKEDQTDSELQREEKEEASSQKALRVQKLQRKDQAKDANYESLDKVLVRHVSRLEKEKSEFLADDRMQIKTKRQNTGRESESSECSLEQVLVKHKSKLEREKMAAFEQQEEDSSQKALRVQKLQRKDQAKDANYESLDKVLVKHVSRLEKEKSEFLADDRMQIKPKRQNTGRESESSERSLEQVLVKHKSKLEREKMAAFEQREEDSSSTRHYSVSRREARERELQAAWGGMSLGNSMRPHVSRLQRDKAAWLEAEEEEKRAAVEGVCEVQSS